MIDFTKLIGAVTQEIEDDQTLSQMPIHQEFNSRTQLVSEKNDSDREEGRNSKQLATQTNERGGGTT
jgi:hypothetical protein